MKCKKCGTAHLVAVVLCILCSSGALLLADFAKPADADYCRRVEADWDKQEHRRGREAHDPAALRDAVTRLTSLADDAQKTAVLDPAFRRQLEEMKQKAGGNPAINNQDRLNDYRQVRWLCRQLAVTHSSLSSQPLVFMKRKRFVCQMLHEYLGYFYDYGDLEGGSVFTLSNPGVSFETADLVKSRLPKGNYATMALSYDAKTIYFAFAERAEHKPAFNSPERKSFHLYEIKTDGSGLRQLTSGIEDDFDPCPLPDGSLAFISSRRGGFGRCHNPWEPLPVYTLHKLDLATGEIVCLSFHETNEWHPFVAEDGRILYSRWDYVDRSAANFHGLWLTNPDGSGTASLFGNYTMQINACYQPKSIPGSHKIAFIAGAHHADVGGSLVVLDPRKVHLDAGNGEDSLDSIERLTPEICFPESSGWPSSYVHSPWPLSEDRFLISFSFEPLAGMGPGEKRDTRTGLYYFDRWGNLELLYEDAGISSMYPIPLAARAKPPVIPKNTDDAMGDEGELLLADVNQSLMALPAERKVKQLRIFQILPKIGSHVANQPRIGHANAESARMFLGTVPVEEDGSAYFRAPARKPLYLQAVDAGGRAVQGMRSALYLQPGEKRGCIGCHEQPGASPVYRKTLSQSRPPSRIAAGPDGSKPMSYMRLIQPILDKRCVSCHDGNNSKSSLDLTSAPQEAFVKSYCNLKPFVRWHEWGDKSISHIATRPGKMGCDESRLTAVLKDANHAQSVGLTPAELGAIYLWLDANVPFYGSYLPEDQAAQLKGDAISPQSLQ